MGIYQIATPQLHKSIEPTLHLDIENELQPHGILLINSESGRSSTIGHHRYLENSPELIVEIAASSTAIDLGDKKRAYRRSGIQEYLVWQVFNQKIDWFSLVNGDYISLTPNSQSIICSQVFPGSCLDVTAMPQGNMPQVLAVLQTGINSAEHQTFVQQLAPPQQEQ